MAGKPSLRSRKCRIVNTGLRLTNRPYKMTVHINHVVDQVPFVVATYSFHYIKEKALINNSQGMIII